MTLDPESDSLPGGCTQFNDEVGAMFNLGQGIAWWLGYFYLYESLWKVIFVVCYRNTIYVILPEIKWLLMTISKGDPPKNKGLLKATGSHKLLH